MLKYECPTLLWRKEACWKIDRARARRDASWPVRVPSLFERRRNHALLSSLRRWLRSIRVNDLSGARSNRICSTILGFVITASLAVNGCDRQEAQVPVAEVESVEIEFIEKAVGKVVPSENAYALKQQGADIVFVSVREQAEWDEYHIPGAIWIPHSKLKEQDEFSWQLLNNLAKTHDYVLTYCGAGHRSGFVAHEAQEKGLKNVYNLDGISFWKERFPVKQGEARAPDKEPKLIHLKEAYFYYQSGFDDVDFVDVREPESIAKTGGEIIKGSKVIPLSELMKNLDKIDCKKDTVLICEGTADGGECTASPAAGRIIIDKKGCKAGHIKYMIEGFHAWKQAGYPVEPYRPSK